CSVTRHERDVLRQIGVESVEQAKLALDVAAFLNLDMKRSERFPGRRSGEVQYDGLRPRGAHGGCGGDEALEGAPGNRKGHGDCGGVEVDLELHASHDVRETMAIA